jgi:hypothetical protein
MLKLNIYFGDDDSDSILHLKVVTSNLNWFKSILELSDPVLARIDNDEIDCIDLGIVLNDDRTNTESVLHEIIFNPDFRIHRINMLDILSTYLVECKCFHLENNYAYQNASSFFRQLLNDNEIKKDIDIHVLMLDLETRGVNIEQINSLAVEELRNLPLIFVESNIKYFASIALAIEFARVKLRYSFVLPSTLHFQSLRFIGLRQDAIAQLKKLMKFDSSFWMEGNDSVAGRNGYYKIFEVFCGIAKVLYSSPIDILRTKSEPPNGWFSENNNDINHIFAVTQEPARHHFNMHLKLPPDRYSFCVHEGLKNIGLNSSLQPPSLYSILLLSSVWNPENCLQISAQNILPANLSNMPGEIHSVKTDECDFAELMFKFYKDFLAIENPEIRKEITVKYSDTKKSLVLTSNQNVMRLFNLIEERLEDPAKYPDNHFCSRYLAECIRHGNWGLIGEGKRIKEPRLFDVSFVGQEIRFSW